MSTNDEAFDAKAFLKTLTSRPGVYRMLNEEGTVLYVGKAKDLKRRVSSYFTRATNRRISNMVMQVRGIEITATHTESEALILENNLIKEHKPKYNVLLRDDKSYPYLFLSDDEFPRLTYHRGAKRDQGRYFGPYPSAGAVKETLHLLQKLFPVRQCENSYFKNRSRACLQYQIQRCTAPCVSFISKERYQQDVDDSVAFLEGKGSDVVQRWVAKMEQAAANLEFEEAGKFRDQITALRAVQEKQYVSGERGDLDIVACAVQGGVACIQIFFVRRGRNLGNKSIYPRSVVGAEAAEVMSAFIAQYYIGKPLPQEILVSEEPTDKAVLEELLSEQAGRKLKIQANPRGERARWQQMALENARISLEARLASTASTAKRLDALQQALNLDETPVRMECFDISHTSGQQTVASCVVFKKGEPHKSDYRRFNISGITGGDDYAAMNQALTRRYKRIKAGDGELPDILFIDGGKAQLKVAHDILAELNISGVYLLGVAKGPDRKPGMEQLFTPDSDQPMILPSHSPALHLIQHIRDESHRFAISGHRAKRGKLKQRSSLEDIAGVGPKRRQRLLKEFGGLQGLQRAGVEDIASVDGVSKKLAKDIYEVFHGEDGSSIRNDG